MTLRSCIYGLLLFAFGTFLNATELFGQNCSQNNVVVERFELRDVNGNPFSSADDYELGEEVTGTLYVVLGGSNSGNAYSTKAFFNILINGSQIGGRRDVCLSQLVNPTFGTAIFATNLTWNWGDLVQLNGLLVRWFTNDNSSNTCDQITENTNKSAQCFSEPNDIVAEIPVQPSLDFDAETCDPTVNFINQTFGGKPPYSYLWEFFDGGTLIGTSTDENPTFTFPRIDTFNVSLSATDDDGITNTLTKPITIPAIEIIIEVTPTRNNESTGSILVQPNGGTGPYTVEWKRVDPEGASGSVSGINNSYLIENLPFGSYEVTVYDSQGCPGFVETFIDIATILFNRMGDINAILDVDQRSVLLNWNTESEGDPGLFIIERADNSDLNFSEIGEMQSTGFSDQPINYSIIDEKLPVSGGRIYYRVKYIVNDEVDMYTELVFVDLSQLPAKVNWSIFPNPAVDNNLTLSMKGHHHYLDRSLSISLYSANFSQTLLVTVKEEEIDLGELIRNFPKGIIIVHIKGNQIDQSLKVLKK
ncbi:MAG: PKD domain-containing protein [Mongoliibacter sp.]|uniref:PKD domain-containing protein n=1 Tax=Mongoliibacter sp. TaxID=2022438 RepID=UPI0012EEFED7|nr:PKD domain-containing protein [Mongoliibacter sp.]TVP51439.1 MAG: PKD domain-containing protein [Mongoliibacter sp.]